jgi:cytoskeletal protein CcmA (bactofilin family)
MFRRKDEDSLFENADTTTQTLEPTSETAAPVSSAPSTSAPVPPTSRFTPESRPAQPATTPAAPTGGNFRTTTNPLSDLTRSRMPEAKSNNQASSAPLPTADKGGKTIRRVLTVGSDILLKGEIATCDRLVIEGKVDATLNDVHTVEITESGSFKGSAQIEDAEISGLFEGDLVVRGRLVIYSSGKVRGKITYGEVEIERGGELSGEIKCGSQAVGAANNQVRSKVAA